MELEYKWRIPKESLSVLAAFLHSHPGRLSQDTLLMSAVYYDTPEQLAHQRGCALRLRRENDRTVCCMKRNIRKDGAQALREEYEVEAETLSEGLKKLPDAGAPEDLCLFFSAQNFCVTAKTEFVRSCYLLSEDSPAHFTAEFAVDVGSLGNEQRMQKCEELELEFKSGDTAAFQQFAEMLQTRFALEPQPLSKYARAIRT